MDGGQLRDDQGTHDGRPDGQTIIDSGPLRDDLVRTVDGRADGQTIMDAGSLRDDQGPMTNGKTDRRSRRWTVEGLSEKDRERTRAD